MSRDSIRKESDSRFHSPSIAKRRDERRGHLIILEAVNRFSGIVTSELGPDLKEGYHLSCSNAWRRADNHKQYSKPSKDRTAVWNSLETSLTVLEMERSLSSQS
jgi:hypothetical protein